MSLHKIWLILQREYLYNIRRRSYLFTAIVIPIVSFALSGLASNFAVSQLDDVGNYQHIGVVDSARIMSGIKLPAPYVLLDSEPIAKAGLQNGQLDLYYVLPTDYVTSGHVDSYSRASLAPGLDGQFLKLVRQALATKVQNPALITRLQDPAPNYKIRRLGSTQVYDQSVLFSSFIVAFGFGLLLFLSISTTSQFLMSGVVEEKENRMMELLVTSSRPSEMLWGKILGLGALGLTQIIIWALLGLVYLIVRGSLDVGTTLANLQITPGLLVLIMAYFVLGYLMFGALMSGLGISVNAEQESRQLSGVISFIAVIPFVLIFSFLSDPNGTLPVIASMFPLTAPLSMILRMAFTTVPPIQIVLSLAILALSAATAIWLAARLFRLGMLNYGKRLGLRGIIGIAFGGRRVITSGATQTEAKT